MIAQNIDITERFQIKNLASAIAPGAVSGTEIASAICATPA
jgi:hypothetical protein